MQANFSGIELRLLLETFSILCVTQNFFITFLYLLQMTYSVIVNCLLQWLHGNGVIEL